MTCGQRVSTPYGSGLIVGFRGQEFVIVALDDGDYVEVGVESVSTLGYHRERVPGSRYRGTKEKTA